MVEVDDDAVDPVIVDEEVGAGAEDAEGDGIFAATLGDGGECFDGVRFDEDIGVATDFVPSHGLADGCVEFDVGFEIGEEGLIDGRAGGWTGHGRAGRSG